MSINIESGFSFNGSLIKKESLKDLAQYGYDSLGLVDKATSFWLPFYLTLKKQNIKPILGLRVSGLRFDLILYPLNYEGYKECLWYASSINNKLSVDLLNVKLSKNIAYCLDMTDYESNDMSYADELISRIKEVTDKVYLGIDFNNYTCEIITYPNIKDRYKIIIIDKVKYLNESDKQASDVLESIMTEEPLRENNLFDLNNIGSNHLRKKDEYLKQYSDYLDLINNTEDFKKLINIDIVFDKTLPKYPTRNGVSSNEALVTLANIGLKKRLQNTNKNYGAYKERLDYELNVIHGMGFDDYFLVVYDFILFAKKNDIYVGPGRGSGASSLVSYCLGIVDIDPMEYGLYFERFLNPSRATMPDIDTDIDSAKRNLVIEYVQKKYGDTHTTLISTYQTFLARSSIEDVGKVLGISEEKRKLISSEIGDENSIKELLKSPKVQKYMEIDSDLKKLVSIAERIEGLPSSIGVHAAGVIISDKDIRDYSEIHIGNYSLYQTNYDMDTIHDIGLLKMDFLSLSNLTTLHEIVDSIYKNTGRRIDLNKIPLNDPKAYKIIAEKSVTGIFQLESPGMNNLAKKMNVRNYSDLAICIALFRPGPMENIPEYLKRREGKSRIDYYDRCLEPILKETLGIMIYQEQIMAVAKEYAGFSLAEADILRRAMSGKDPNLILNLKDKFIDGSRRLGRNENTTLRLFDDIYKFSGYGFNKAHTIAYSRITYELAYLKANYPREFMMNLLKTTGASMKIIKECAQIGLRVTGPHYLYSSNTYESHGSEIYMPYTSIKGIGDEFARKISSTMIPRGDNSFESSIQRLKDSGINRSIIESLIMAGVFDYTNYNKRSMMESLDGLLEFGRISISGIQNKIKITDEYEFDYLKNNEFALLKFNPKYHPMKKYLGNLPKISDLKMSQQSVTSAVYITDLRVLKTKTGDNYAVFNVEDEFMSVRGVMFNKTYLSCAHYLENSKFYEVSGIYNENRGEPQFVVRRITPINV